MWAVWRMKVGGIGGRVWAKLVSDMGGSEMGLWGGAGRKMTGCGWQGVGVFVTMGGSNCFEWSALWRSLSILFLLLRPTRWG